MAAASAKRSFNMVVAATEAGGIGKGGSLPWRLPGDMAFFKKVTTDVSDISKRNAVIMGRRTWSSIPSKFRPLPGRLNVVLSTSSDVREVEGLPDEVVVATSLEGALERLATPGYSDDVESVFLIGGAAAFTEALSAAELHKVYLTTVHGEVECDTTITHPTTAGFLPSLSSLPITEKGLTYHFSTLSRDAPTGAGESKTPAAPAVPLGVYMASLAHRTGVPTGAASVSTVHEEQQYLDIVRDILTSGVKREDRTGTGTLSKFGVTMRFSLRGGVLPLLTTKRVFWRGVAEELLWFLSGDTYAKTLSDKGIRIWDGNGSAEFLAKRGLGHREEGDLGPVYGFQWRHFGAAYGSHTDDYTGAGVDQVASIVHTLKTNPTCRRMVLSAWNPAALPEMALPPCHMMCQFYVADGEVSCAMYQRSADMGLGVPFNIASYALLTRLVAQAAGLGVGDLVHVIGDAHVYLNHVDALWQQLEREPRPFPTLAITPTIKDIDGFTYGDLTVEGYAPHKTIKMAMAV